MENKKKIHICYNYFNESTDVQVRIFFYPFYCIFYFFFKLLTGRVITDRLHLSLCSLLSIGYEQELPEG